MPIPPPLAVYLLTAFALAVVLGTRQVLRGAGRRVRPGHGVSPTLLRTHTGVGLLAAVLWIAFLTIRADGQSWHSLMGVVGLAGWWITSWVGLLLLGRWLPTRGRHSEAGTRWVGPFLVAAVAYVGVAVASGGFTLAYVFGSV